jgi:hypothetical protein
MEGIYTRHHLDNIGQLKSEAGINFRLQCKHAFSQPGVLTVRVSRQKVEGLDAYGKVLVSNYRWGVLPAPKAPPTPKPPRTPPKAPKASKAPARESAPSSQGLRGREANGGIEFAAIQH